MGSREEELRFILHDLGVGPYFLGTFDKHFPGFISKDRMSCAIVNTAGRETGGVHWLAMAWHPASQTFYMFDPFGFSDQKLKQIYNFEYQGLLKRSALTSTADRCLTLIQSTQSVQGPNSAACGLFCCMFLHAFVRWPLRAMDNNPTMNLIHGVPNNMLESPSSQNVFLKNQQNLYRFLRRHSSHFVKHAAQIESDTAFDKMLTN
ncbi:protease [Bovine adenovirus 3]|uniref:Protease n=1 Tax=Bovine adenovirus B serotype 3 TaxID=10510 RepID=A0A9W3IMP2_ADEB3|nr:protease [Bovine adenovirus 3]